MVHVVIECPLSQIILFFSFLTYFQDQQSVDPIKYTMKGFIICIVYQNHYEDRSQDVVGPWSHGDCRKGKPNNDLYTPTFCSMGTGGELVNNCNGGSYYFFFWPCAL